MTHRAPLSVLDLSPFGSGQTPADGLRASIELARRAEQLGYRRYWLAEHHLNPGISGAAPHVLLAAVAAATDRIRIGTAATIIGNSTPLQVVEAAGVVSALHPGRFDLGIGRSGGRSSAEKSPARPSPETPHAAPAAPDRIVDGLVIPAPVPFPIDAPRFAAQARLLGRAVDEPDTFEQNVHDILALIAGTYVPPEGVPIHATPAEGEDIEVWIHGSSAGRSARLAGALGLPFGANYHVAPFFVLEAVEAYREAFVPGRLAAPRVVVSVDVVVAPTDAAARELAAGYPQWVHSIRAGQGAIPYPTAREARVNPLDADAAAAVHDRSVTQFVGSPERVAERLDTLQRVTGADELLVTTITHDPADRVRSYALLAEEWEAPSPPRHAQPELAGAPGVLA